MYYSPCKMFNYNTHVLTWGAHKGKANIFPCFQKMIFVKSTNWSANDWPHSWKAWRLSLAVLTHRPLCSSWLCMAVSGISESYKNLGEHLLIGTGRTDGELKETQKKILSFCATISYLYVLMDKYGPMRSQFHIKIRGPVFLTILCR